MANILNKSILLVVITVLGCKAMNIPLDSSGFFGALTANAPRSSDILSHGCICSTFGVNGINSQVGNANTLDVIDSICKDWKAARKCLRMIGGACELNDLSGTYLILGGICQASDVTAPADTCDGACCMVDVFYVSMINDALTSNPSWTPSAPTVATCPIDFGNGVGNDACCGTAPAVYMYNYNTGLCDIATTPTLAPTVPTTAAALPCAGPSELTCTWGEWTTCDGLCAGGSGRRSAVLTCIPDAGFMVCSGSGRSEPCINNNSCNSCTCINGNSASPTDCLVDSSQQCESCFTGFTLNSVTLLCDPVPCTTGFHRSASTGLCVSNICVCQNGIPVFSPSVDCTTDGGIACTDCNPGFGLNAATQDCDLLPCAGPGELTCTWSAWTSCNGACGGGSGTESRDETCAADPGFNLCSGGGSGMMQSCTNDELCNICTCAGGVSAPPNSCLINFSEQCESCVLGFTLNSGTLFCDANVCVCPNGIPALTGGADCTTNGSTACSTCNQGFTINSVTQFCDANVCVCPNGIPASTGSADCTTHGGTVCSDCNPGFGLNVATQDCDLLPCAAAGQISCTWSEWTTCNGACDGGAGTISRDETCAADPGFNLCSGGGSGMMQSCTNDELCTNFG